MPQQKTLFFIYPTVCSYCSAEALCSAFTGNDYLTVLVLYVFIAPLTNQPSAVVIEDKERTCDSLLMCIVTVLSHGLRSGGGVGDVLRKASKEVKTTGT